MAGEDEVSVRQLNANVAEKAVFTTSRPLDVVISIYFQIFSWFLEGSMKHVRCY